MKGLELAKAYYEDFGRQMIHDLFPEYENRIAVGLVGKGSDCLKYDDEVSRDHDIEPGFMMWICKEDEEKIEFALSRAYDRLPKEYKGFQKGKKSSYWGGRYGVRVIDDFFMEFTGRKKGPEKLRDWLYIPEYAMAEISGGEIFADPLGEFSRLRKRIQIEMPEDVRKKKIAARALTMAQSGQYNYLRSMNHKEVGGASLALSEFVKATGSMIFLLNRKHAPFYKWLLRGVKELPILGYLSVNLENLVVMENGWKNKEFIFNEIEKISREIIGELNNQNLSDGVWGYLEPHGYEIQSKIENEEMRNLHIMEG